MSVVDDVWITAAPLVICLLLLVAGARAGAARDRARTEARLAALERKVDAVLDHLGVVVPEPRYPEVEQLLAEGRQVAAVKAYREQTGADLLTAKQAVDGIAERAR
jgi:ribosomal protein L7/L12